MRTQDKPYSTTALAQTPGVILRELTAGPIQLTTYGHHVAVLLSQADWQRLTLAVTKQEIRAQETWSQLIDTR